MSFSLSPDSLKKLLGVHPDLQKLVQEIASQGMPVLVVEGFRDEAAQTKAFQTGHSKEKWPLSKHNSVPAHAVDLSPVPYDSLADKQLYFFAGFVLGIAKKLNIPIRWGGNWKQDFCVYTNGPFTDLYHFELIN